MKTVAVLLALLVVSGAYAQDWRDTLDLARKAYSSKDYDKALGYYEKAQKSAPEGVDFSDEMGQSAYKAEKYEVAEKIYQQNQANKVSDKEQADNFHNLGNTRMRNKDYKGAAEAYKDALRRNPNDKKTRYNLSEAMRQLKKKQREEQKKNQQQQQQNQQQSQGNKQQQNGSNQQQSNNGQQQQSQNGSNSQQQKGQNQSKQQRKGQGNPSNSGDQKNGKGQLSNKSAERMLDDLMKREAETQRRMAGAGSGGGKSKSGKDW